MLKTITVALVAAAGCVLAAPPALADEVTDAANDSGGVLCHTLAPGSYPPDLYVAADGDVYRGGTKVLDCVPYGG